MSDKAIRQQRSKLVTPAALMGFAPVVDVQHLADMIPGILAIYNVNSGQYVFVNRAMTKILGYTPAEFIKGGMAFAVSIVHPDDLSLIMTKNEAALKAVAKAKPGTIAKEPIVNFEYRMRHKNGQWVWLQTSGGVYDWNDQGKVEHVLNISIDITERKRAEEDVRLMAQQILEESEQRFRNMADSAPVLIWEADANKACTYFNKAWLDFTGRTLKQEVGNGWEADIHPDDLEDCKQTYSSNFDARQTYRTEYRIRHHDGEYRLVLDTGTPRYAPDGKFLGYIGCCIDIDDMRKNEDRRLALAIGNEVLKRERSELIALAQAKDEFISLASHQLRTPATGVKQYIGMMLEGFIGELSASQLKTLRTAYESNERQIHIIDDLLKVAHIDAGIMVLKKRRTDMVRLLKAVTKEQAHLFKAKDQTLTFLYSGQRISAVVDPARLRMAIENMVSNAHKYTPAGKNITLTLSDDGQNITIRIQDQGVGIAAKDLAKLFQKFSRVHNVLSTQVGGTGLGLYLAKKIVDLHDGNIEVTSRRNHGSTFTISVPKDTL